MHPTPIFEELFGKDGKRLYDEIEAIPPTPDFPTMWDEAGSPATIPA